MVSSIVVSGFLKMSKHLKRLIWSYRIHFLDVETAFEFSTLNSSDFWAWFARNARASYETSPPWPPPGMPRRSQASLVTTVTSHGTCVLCQTAGWDALLAPWTPASKSPGWAQACQRWEIGKCQVLKKWRQWQWLHTSEVLFHRCFLSLKAKSCLHQKVQKSKSSECLPVPLSWFL